MTRESWLQDLAERLRPWFAENGLELPAYRVSCGWPSRGARAAKSRRIGECWVAEASVDGHREIFISPVLDDQVEVAATLVHELIHAALPPDAKHGPTFARAARTLLLEGKPTETTASPAFREFIAPHLEAVGKYPHARLRADSRRAQSTRLLKVECPECGYTARVTRKWVESVGTPLCPDHGAMDLAV